MNNTYFHNIIAIWVKIFNKFNWKWTYYSYINNYTFNITYNDKNILIDIFDDKNIWKNYYKKHRVHSL